MTNSELQDRLLAWRQPGAIVLLTEAGPAAARNVRGLSMVSALADYIVEIGVDGEHRIIKSRDSQ